MKTFLFILCGAILFQLQAKNIALGKPYTLFPEPNYKRTTGPEDFKDLTDGKKGTKYIWHDKNAVGWHHLRNGVDIIIDLKKNEPISGVTWSTAAGEANLQWPAALPVFVSSDRKNWYFVSELVSASPAAPPIGRYSRKVFRSGPLKTWGRYVRITADCKPFTFCDEIEVFRGDPANLKQKHTGKALTDPRRLLPVFRSGSMLKRRLQKDLALMKKRVFSAAEKKQLLLFEKQAEKLSFENIKVDAVLPFNALQKKIYALNAGALQRKGYKKPFLWEQCRWEPLKITAIPPKAGIKSLTVKMMRNDPRSASFIICNPTKKDLFFDVKATGLPSFISCEIREVLFTETASLQAVASALSPLKNNKVHVPAGGNRQVWLKFSAAKGKGVFKGKAQAVCGKEILSVPVEITVADLDMPARPYLHTGGFENSDRDCAHFKGQSYIKESHKMWRYLLQDTPFSLRLVMPQNAKFDKQGNLINKDKLDFTNLDRWLTQWRDARQLMIYLGYHYLFFGFELKKAPTPVFERMVTSYFSAVVERFKHHGRKPQDLILLIFDEPQTKAVEKNILLFGRILRKADLGLRIMEDPCYADPTQASREMLQLCDILCPQTLQLVSEGEKFKKFYQAQNKELWLYSCSGPAKLLDPVFYYRIQPYLAFEMGAVGSFFWAYGDAGRSGTCWQPYQQNNVEYSPYFTGKGRVLPSKQSEGIREGIQDHTRMEMLRRRILQLEKQKSGIARAASAKAALAAAVASCIDGHSYQKTLWIFPKDRGVFDRASGKVLDLLTGLK